MKRVFIYGIKDKLKNYIEALEFSSAQPVVSLKLSDSDECDALVLPGGGDIDPALYGMKIHGSHGIEHDRDLAELDLARRFYATDRPVLGICKGMQIVNVAFGGNLIQDIETSATHKWEENTGDKVHLIKAAKTSFLYQLYGESFPVNSAHHQGVNKIANGFSAAAWGDDGIIEAMECKEKRVYCVQWHPERMSFNKLRADTVDGSLIFDFFLKLLE